LTVHPLTPPAGLIALLVLGGLVWRLRVPERPLTARRILLPPLGMTTGSGMFLLPALRLPWGWAVAALLAGAFVLSYPLRRLSRLSWRGDALVLPRTWALPAVLICLAALRLGFRGYADRLLPPGQTAGLSYLLALGMIGSWRLSLYREFRRLRAVSGGLDAERPEPEPLPRFT
jgi:membrane protein CcdC involved in cytochrome C biogenesis